MQKEHRAAQVFCFGGVFDAHGLRGACTGKCPVETGRQRIGHRQPVCFCLSTRPCPCCYRGHSVRGQRGRVRSCFYLRTSTAMRQGRLARSQAV